MATMNNSQRRQTEPRLQWSMLPPEIRLMILKAFICQKNTGWASCAAVCKEWHHVIARENFSHLRLQESCLDGFENIVRHRQFIRHIWLDIELPRYSCADCSHPESLIDESTIRYAVYKLLFFLSTWRTSDCTLKLEINASSLSDSEYWFKNYLVEPSYDDSEPDTQLQKADAQWDDPAHGWVNGKQVGYPDAPAINQVFDMCDSPFSVNLPRVDAVTTLVIRRQFRQWIPPASLYRLLEKLPRLECLAYEFWSIREPLASRYFAQGMHLHPRDRAEALTKVNTRILTATDFKELIEFSLPKTIKSLLLFEDFDPQISESQKSGTMSSYGNVIADMDLEWGTSIGVALNADQGLNEALAVQSLNLTQLSLAYMIDATLFFRATKPCWTWHSLESLALTSELLSKADSPEEISALLYHAGTAALRMPKLHTMALWGGKKGEACAFTYSRQGLISSIAWRGTRDLQLTPRVVEAWQRVASQFSSAKLRVTTEHLEEEDILSHGDAIHRLGLPCRVVDPVSLRQIRREWLTKG